MIELPDLAIRLGLALAFGAIIGVEREWRLKQAGLKTMALVAMGSAAFAMMSDTFGEDNHNPGQIAAAVVGGIGFLGAGVIMHRGLTVQGLTTAATLWSSASVGVAAGLNHPTLACGLTVAIVITQVVGRRIEKWIRSSRRNAFPGRFELRVECDSDSLSPVNKVWESFGAAEPLRTSVQRGPESLLVRVVLRAPAGADLGPLSESMVAIPGVRRIDVRHLGIDDD